MLGISLCFESHLSLFFCQVENGKKTLILHGTKTSAVLNSVLSDIYNLKRDNAVKYSKKNDNIRPFESGGETSLEFFSLKTDCSLIVVSDIVLTFL
jgi:ribosome production factor 2